MKIIVNRPDDETTEIVAMPDDGTLVDIITVTHDEHGWSGINAVEDTVEAIAKALGIPLEYTEESVG